MENKPKVLILFNQLRHYRIPILNILSEKCKLTVTYSEGKGDVDHKCLFNVLYLPVIKFGGRFVIQKANVRKIAKEYDVVIAYGEISWLKFSTLPWFNRQKVIFWTLGVSASYTKGYDVDKKWDKIRKFFYDKADALVFYTEYPILKYSKMGVKKDKMFIAHNTVAVEPLEQNNKKDSILFIGTLYRQKGIQKLLDSYLTASKKVTVPVLNIIGEGPDFDNIKVWINDNGLKDKINLCGAIYNIREKAKYFSKAIACISPNQAGLSVLESMGYGVPFVTTKNAITGGELFNIHNGIDGVVMSSINELTNVLVDISSNINKYSEMGIKAKQYYDNNRSPYIMADGVWKAINYVLN